MDSKSTLVMSHPRHLQSQVSRSNVYDPSSTVMTVVRWDSVLPFLESTDMTDEEIQAARASNVTEYEIRTPLTPRTKQRAIEHMLANAWAKPLDRTSQPTSQ